MTGLQPSTRLTWQDYAEKLQGRILTVRGVEVRIEVILSPHRAGEYTTEVIGHPTEAGKLSSAYLANKEHLQDDWLFVWMGEYPIEVINALAGVEYDLIGKVYSH